MSASPPEAAPRRVRRALWIWVASLLATLALLAAVASFTLSMILLD